MTDMLHAAVLTPLEDAINYVLTSDTLSSKILAPLTGRVVAIHNTDVGRTLYILLDEQGVQLQGALLNTPDVTLSGTTAQLAQLVTSDNKSEQFFGHGISVEGDSHLANHFQTALAALQIDWEALLAEHMGDLAAHESWLFIQQKAAFLGRAQQSFRANIQEYIQEEAQWLPSRPEAEHVMNQIDEVRQRTDRLSARIQHLSDTLNLSTHT